MNNISTEISRIVIGMTWLTITLTMLGKFAITYSWGATYVFTAELYPTTVRNVGVAACTAFANIGATLAPQISYMVSLIYHIKFLKFDIRNSNTNIMSDQF